MAELNFGLLTPPGSQSIGNAFAQGMDQAAVARAQENQNALAQYTLSKAKREDELNTQLLGDLRNATTNDEIYRAYQRAGKGDVASKLRGEGLTQDKTRLEIAGMPATQANTRAQTAVRHGTVMKNEATRVLADPTFANAMQAVVNFGKATGQDVTQEIATITSMGNDPVKIANWAKGHAVTGEQLLNQSKPPDVARLIEYRNSLTEGRDRNAVTAMIEKASNENYQYNPNTGLFELRQGQQQPGAAPASRAFVDRGIAQGVTPLLQASSVDEARRQAIAMNAAGLPVNIRGGGNALAGAQPQPAAVVNNMPGAATAAAAPVVNNLPTAQPPAVAPTAYSPKTLRDMALKGMQPDGKGGQTPIPGGEADPAVKQQVSTAQAVGAQIGKNNAVALEKLPNAIATGKELIRKLDELLGDANVVNGQVTYNTAPAAGFDSAFGPTGIIARAYPSSEAAGFQARVKEILGGAFLEAYETLRGAQGITDIEGKKATEARTRMGFDLSKTEFITAAREYRKTAAEALARSETRLNSLQRSAAPAGAPPLAVIFNTQRPQ